MVALWCFCFADVVEFPNGKAGTVDDLLFAAVQYTTSTIVSIFYCKFFHPNKSLDSEGGKYSLSVDRESKKPVYWTTENLCNLK